MRNAMLFATLALGVSSTVQANAVPSDIAVTRKSASIEKPVFVSGTRHGDNIVPTVSASDVDLKKQASNLKEQAQELLNAAIDYVLDSKYELTFSVMLGAASRVYAPVLGAVIARSMFDYSVSGLPGSSILVRMFWRINPGLYAPPPPQQPLGIVRRIIGSFMNVAVVVPGREWVANYGFQCGKRISQSKWVMPVTTVGLQAIMRGAARMAYSSVSWLYAFFAPVEFPQNVCEATIQELGLQNDTAEPPVAEDLSNMTYMTADNLPNVMTAENLTNVTFMTEENVPTTTVMTYAQRQWKTTTVITSFSTYVVGLVIALPGVFGVGLTRRFLIGA